MPYKPNFLWTNHHQNVHFRVARLYDAWNRLPGGGMPTDKAASWNAGIVTLQSILQEAEKEKKCVRAGGAGWSLSEVAKTSDYYINTQPLNLIYAGIEAAWAERENEAPKLVLAQCGAGVLELNKKLFEKGLALPTSGASDGQTIAGAISTGTHGSALNFGSMQDFVVGLHIITGSKEHFWVEPNEKYVSDAFIATMTGIKRINNDEIFNAALVSFGSFGVIHALLLHAEPLYVLSATQKYFPWSVASQCINGPGNYEKVGLKPNLFDFELILNPYVLKEVAVRGMYKLPGNTPTDHKGVDSVYGIGPDVLTLFGQIFGLIPSSVPKMMKFLQAFLRKMIPEVEGYKDYPGSIFSGGAVANQGAAMATEMGIDAADTSKAMAIIFKEIVKVPLPGTITLRYIKKSRATLAFTRFDTTCVIEILSPLSDQTQRFFVNLWQRLETENIPFTFHWGQCNNLNAARLQKQYGNAAIKSWIDARNQILVKPQQRLMFSNDFLYKCGLAGESFIV